MTNTESPTQLTTAFYAQSIISFGASVTGVAIGIYFLPSDAWIRGFLILGLAYVITSTFTLSKCVRDWHEINQVAQPRP